MDKETLSNYGWIVICVIVVGLMLALASPLGQMIQDSINGVVTKFNTKATGALDSTYTTTGA